MTYAKIAELHEFLENAGGSADKLWIGIDPGTHGAFGLLAGDHALAVDIPVSWIANARGRLNGVYELNAILHFWEGVQGHITASAIRVCLEEGQGLPGDGAFTAFRCGEGFGMWPLYLQSIGIRVDTARPAVWKKYYGLRGGPTQKEAARLKALSMWPSCTCLSRKKDHNRAEALLLADYLRRKESGSDTTRDDKKVNKRKKK